MKYMGSKNRHASELLAIMLKVRREGQAYVEPFVGGFNVIDKVVGRRFANDINPYLISLFSAVVGGWLPPDSVSEETYADIRDNRDRYPPELIGFVGFGCSYAGKFFGGYARGNTSGGSPRNYCAESKRNILKQAGKLKEVTITCRHYSTLNFPDRSLIYCDPPYQGTTGYGDSFDHDIFWQWVREQAQQGHSVFVSEYSAPPDFTPVWRKKVNNTLVENTGAKQGVECLFYAW